MTNYREILRLHAQGFSQRSIAASCDCGKSTVQRTVTRANRLGLVWPLAPELTNEQLRKLLFGADAYGGGVQGAGDTSGARGAGGTAGGFKEPDYEYIHKELAKKGVTLSLLWSEYSAKCRDEGSIAYKYSAFCSRYRNFAMHTKATMRLERKPAEQMEVDWAGKTMEIVDRVTGEIIPAYVFVSVLSYSGFAYVEAFLSQKQQSWITGHVNAYRHYGGATRILVPDNLKTGVTKRTKSDIILNSTYQEMAEYYGTAVLPTRVRKPKDKPAVEGAVSFVSTWIMAALRNQKFFGIKELNDAIAEKLDELNSKPFQKRVGSRVSVFLEEEAPMLLPLPDKPYELSEWKTCIVAYNYHVSVDKMLYSVPHTYIKQEVDVRITSRIVEVFFKGDRIASHVRKFGKPSQYSTIEDHMPPDHKNFSQWNAERFRSWARSIGKSTLAVVNVIFASRKIEQQGYRTCMALLKLGDKYSHARLEAACKRALSYTTSPNFKIVQTILATGQDMLPDEEQANIAPSPDFGFTRGSAYYGLNSTLDSTKDASANRKDDTTQGFRQDARNRKNGGGN